MVSCSSTKINYINNYWAIAVPISLFYWKHSENNRFKEASRPSKECDYHPNKWLKKTPMWVGDGRWLVDAGSLDHLGSKGPNRHDRDEAHKASRCKSHRSPAIPKHPKQHSLHSKLQLRKSLTICQSLAEKNISKYSKSMQTS